MTTKPPAPAKALINSPETVVVEAIEGLVAAHPHLARLDGMPQIKVVIDSTHDKSKVAVVSGGGSGHDPAMAGYVGAGMLAAAVCGDVFASPSEDAVLAAIRAVTGLAGCLLIVMNYTGDRLNFGAAAERAKAEGLQVEMVVTADDCALKSSSPVGRRGIAGTVLVHKIAGAAAANGASLAEVRAAAEAASASVGTMGCSLTSCQLFGQPPSERLGPNELEMGLGIHGEPGAYREKMRPLNGIVDELLSKIAGESDSYLPVQKGDRVVLLVNNLGSTTPLELHAAAHAASGLVESQLHARLERLYCGAFMTSLSMHGLSLTLMRVADDAVLALLDAPTQAPAWPASSAVFSGGKPPLPLPAGSTDEFESGSAPAPGSGSGAAAGSGSGGPLARSVRRCVEAACQAVLGSEVELNSLDAKVGDGDCGTTLAQGATGILSSLPNLPLGDPAKAAVALARVAGRSMGGTSGAVYKILLTAVGASLAQQQRSAAAPASAARSAATPASAATLSLPALARALKDGAEAVSRYGGAVAGSRTMLDALLPAAQALSDAAAAGKSAHEAAQAAASAAAQGAEATKQMAASAGRSSYVPAEELAGNADPGAVAVARWMAAVAGAVE